MERGQALNEELAAANEEMTATNEELHRAQDALHILNRELEERVGQRTQAQAASEENFHSIIMQAPVAMCFLWVMK